MRKNRNFSADLGRILGMGATLMVVAYLLDSIINADMVGESVFRQILSPDARGLAVRLGYLSILLLFIAYVCSLMVRRRGLENALVKYQAGMDASMDGIFFLDKQRRLTYLNLAHARLHGYASHAEVQGASWRHFYDDQEVERLEREIFPALAADGKWRGETVGKRKDGSTFPQEISCTALDGDSTVCIVRDVSEQQKFKKALQRKAEELAEANGELEAFGYSLTHDIRNHLTRIYTAAQILRDNYGESLDKSGRMMVGIVCNANEEMDRLITDMMVLSRIGRDELNREEVDLSRMAEGIVSSLRLVEPHRAVEFKITPGLSANCDPQLIKIALDNLLRNAWKYTGKAASALIEFSAADEEGRRVFFVRDNGVGFEMADADKLFTPFHRLHSAQAFPGTGIGLTTVQRIIERHGGEIWGEGEPGRGARFYFTIPSDNKN